jgi:hypothetical protein
MLMKSPEKLVHTMSIKKFGQGGEYPTCLDKKKFIRVVFFCFQIRHLFDKFLGQKFGNLENKFICQQAFLLPATIRTIPVPFACIPLQSTAISRRCHPSPLPYYTLGLTNNHYFCS